MAIGQATVSLPVRLTIENLLSIMNDLLSKLGNLKVGSKGFKEVLSIMNAIGREIDRLLILTSKPFVNLSQFNLTERTIGKIEDDLERVQITMSRINFSDLLLTPDQTTQMKEFEALLESIKSSIKNVKDTAKLNFLSGESGGTWLGIDPTAINQSLGLITTAINAAVRKLKTALDEAEAKLKEYLDTLAQLGKLLNFANAIGKASDIKGTSQAFGDMYSKIFTATGTGFKTGGRKVMEEWLINELDLDPEKVRLVVSQKASAVIESLLKGELNNLISNKINSLSTKASNMPSKSDLTANVDSARAKYEALRPVLEDITAANDSVATSEENLKIRLRDLNTTVEEYKEKITAAARSNQEIGKTCASAGGQLVNFRNLLALANTQFLQLERALRNFNSIKMTITNFMGFTLVLNLTKRAIRDALNHIKELDSVMNKISIVTNMTTSDLWNQVDAYSQMALKYGVSIKGAYEVSQIYYQQGLQTKDVLTLTNETLKLAKVSGLDYAQTTDYMTTALRGFKMEMSEASIVVDVYSNLAAHTAVTQEELAVAMSKTASSLESVGSSFQESSAMISTMVAVTRESATNIGSALKSIAARYGEMKKDPSALIDSEGEAMAFNKVDTALLSVGISMRDTNGQFRNFTEVIIELSDKWNTLESTLQRYIATLFAGNRQQSRFLALVSNGDLLKSNLLYAENSEDTGTLLTLKALDSIESKTELVKVAYQQLYTTIGAEDMWKGFLDGAKNVMETMNGLPKLFNKVPIGAIAMVADFVNVIKTIGLNLLGGISKVWDKILPTEIPSKMATIAELTAEVFSKTIQSKIQETDVGGQMTDKVADLAAKAGLDKNRSSGDTKTVEKAAEPAKTNVEEHVASAEAAKQAALSTVLANEANALARKEAAEAAKEEAEAVRLMATALAGATRSISTALELTAALTGTTLTENILTLLSGFTIDTNTPIQQVLNMFVQILHSVLDSSGVLRLAFSEASDDAIGGYVHTLLEAAGVKDAGKIVGQISVLALRDAIGAHSDADETIAAAEDYNGGYVHTITAKIGEAAAAGKAYADASIEAMRQELSTGLDKELEALDALKLLGLQLIISQYGKNGLTVLQTEDFVRRREDLEAQKISIKLQFSPMLAKVEERDALLALVDELQSKKLSREVQLNASSTGVLPELARDYVNGAYYDAAGELLKLTTEKNEKLELALAELDKAKAKVEELERESSEINRRIAEIGSMGKIEQFSHRKEKEALMERQLVIFGQTNDAKKAYGQALIKYKLDENEIATTYNPRMALQEQRMSHFAEKAVRDYNDSIYLKQEPMRERIEALDDEIRTARSERASQLRAVLRSEEALAQELARTVQANEAEKARLLAENDAKFNGMKELAKSIASLGEATLSTIPTIEALLAAEAERQRQEEEERRRLEEELRRRQAEEDAAYKVLHEDEKGALAHKERLIQEDWRQWEYELGRHPAFLARLESEGEAGLTAFRNGEIPGAENMGPVIPISLRLHEGAEATITNGVLEVKNKVQQLVDATPIDVPTKPTVEEGVVEDVREQMKAKLAGIVGDNSDLYKGVSPLIDKITDRQIGLEGFNQDKALRNIVSKFGKEYGGQQIPSATQGLPTEAELRKQLLSASGIPLSASAASKKLTQAVGLEIEGKTEESLALKDKIYAAYKDNGRGGLTARDTLDLNAPGFDKNAAESYKQLTEAITQQLDKAHEEIDSRKLQLETDIAAVKAALSSETTATEAKEELKAIETSTKTSENDVGMRVAEIKNAYSKDPNVLYLEAVGKTDEQLLAAAALPYWTSERLQLELLALQLIRDEALKVLSESVTPATNTESIELETAAILQHTEAVEADKLALLQLAPELGASLDSIINMLTGDALDKSGVTQLLSDLKEAGVITEQVQGLLLKLFETQPSELFVSEYAKLTLTISTIADANKAIEFQDSKVAQEIIEAASKPPAQLMMDFDNLSSDKFLEIPVKPNTEEFVELTTEAIEQVKGQLTLEPRIEIAQVDALLDSLKEKLNELLNYTFNSQTGMFVNPTTGATMTEADHEALEMSINDLILQLLELKLQLVASLGEDMGASPDVTALKELILDLVDKLVESGLMGQEAGNEIKDGLANASPEELSAKMEELKAKTELVGAAGLSAGSKLASMNFSTLGSAIRMLASISGLSLQVKGAITLLGGAITAVGVVIKMVDSMSKSAAASNPWMGIAMAIMAIVNGISMLVETDAERLERLEKAAEEASNKAKLARSDIKELENGKKKVEELTEKRFESAEATEEYQNAVDDLAEKFPQLIAGFDEAGNVILDTTEAERVLTKARDDAAAATLNAAKAEMEAAKEKVKLARKELKKLQDAIGVNDGGPLISPELKEERGIRRSQIYTNTLQGLNDSYDPISWEQMYGIDASGMTSNDLLHNIYDFWEKRSKGSQHYFDKYKYGQTLGYNLEYSDEELWDIAEGAATFLDTLAAEPYNFLENAVDENYNVSLDKLKEYYDKKFEAAEELTEEEQEIYDLFFTDAGSGETLAADFALKMQTLRSKLGDEDVPFEEVEAAYEEANRSLRELYTSGLFDTQELAGYSNTLGEIGAEMQKVVSFNDIYKGYEKEVISAWLSSIAANSDAWEVLSTSSSAAAIVTKHIKASIDAAGVDYDTAILNGMEAEWQLYQLYMADFIQTLSPESVEKFNKMVADPTHYTSDDIIKEFGIQDENLIAMIEGYYANGIKQTQERLLQSLAKAVGNSFNANTRTYDAIGTKLYATLTEFLKSFFDLTEKNLTSKEETYLNNVLKKYSALSNAGYTDKAETYGNKALEVFDYVDELDADVLAAVWDAILNNDITTKEGIDNAIKAILSNDNLAADLKKQLTDKLIAAKENIVSSFGLELQTAVDAFLNEWKDNSKTFSKLTSGLDINDVESIINSLTGKDMGLAFTDFVMDGNKLVLTAEKAQDYVDNYFIDLRNKLLEYLNSLDESLGVWAKKDAEGKFTGETTFYKGTVFNQSGLAEVESLIGVGELEKYAEKQEDGSYIITSAEKAQELAAAVNKGYKDAQDYVVRYGEYLDWSEEQITKANEWKVGNYSSLKKIFNLEDSADTNAELEKKLKEITERGADLSDYVDTPDVKNAVAKMLGATSKLLSDIISKGIVNIDFDTFDFTDYEGLPEWIATDLKNRAFESNYEIAKAYVKYIGGTIEDSNNMIISALDKDNEKTVQDAIKGLNFINNTQFTATSSELKDFANKFDLDLAELIDSGLVYYDKTLEEYVVNYTDISGLDLSQVNNFNETVQDSIDNLFKELATTVKNAIDGALNNVERLNLINQARDYGVSLDKNKDFVKTNDGWQLTIEATDRLLLAMKEGDASIAEMNNLAIAQYNRKVQEYTTTDIQDLTFLDNLHFAASDSELLTLADKFNLDLYSLMEEGLVYWNELLGEYVVDWLNIDNLESGFSEIDHFEETVKDSIKQFFSNFTDLVTKGIDGTLNNMEVGQLKDLATKFGIDPDTLTFTETAEGLKLSNESAKQLYLTIDAIDGKQGTVVFEKLKENLLATSDAFKSVQTTAAHTKKTVEEIAALEREETLFASAKREYNVARSGSRAPKIDAFDHLQGNVNMYDRPWIENEDGSHSTISSMTYLNEQVGESEVHMIMTPIPEWAKKPEDVLTDEEMDEYVSKIMDQEPLTLEEVIELDAKGVTLDNGKKVSNMLIDIKDASATTTKLLREEEQELHEWSDAWESARNGVEAPDNSERIEALKEELAIAQEILNIRATSEDDSFKFMDNEIPAGQNNPLNYLESWASAYEAINNSISGDADNKGFMGYQDFYNIVTEMGNLADITGLSVSIGGKVLKNSEEAASLIEQAAGALKVTGDGKLKVDLSSIGVDFKTGANEMNKSVDEGIDAVADALISMLTSMIKLLEVIVAMEKLGDVDIDKSGSLELGEIFELDINGDPITGADGLPKYTESFLKAAKSILEFAAEEGNEELNQALDDIRINGYTLRELLEDAEDGIKNLDIGMEAYTAAFNALYQAALSGDYDLDNIGESLYKILRDSGLTECEIDVGDLTYYMHGDSHAVVDWSNEKAIKAGEEAIDEFIDSHKDLFDSEWLGKLPTIKQKVAKINQLLADETLDAETRAELEIDMKIILGEITIEKDKNGKFTGTYKELLFTGKDEAEVRKKILAAMQLEEEGFKFEVDSKTGELTGKMLIGKSTIEVSEKNGQKIYKATASDGSHKDNCTSKEAALNWLATKGDGQTGTYTFEGKNYSVFVNSETGLTYSVTTNDANEQEFIAYGEHFKSWEALLNYLAFRKGSLGGTMSEKTVVDGEEIRTTVKGRTQLTYNYETGKLTYSFLSPPNGDPIDFASELDYKDYLAAYELSGGNVDLQGNPTYEASGAIVTVTVDTEGKVHFHAELPNNLGSIDADTEAGLKLGLATAVLLHGGVIDSSNNEKAEFTYNSNEGYSLTADITGEITVTGDEDAANKGMEKFNTALLSAIDSTNSAESVNGSISSATVDASEATVSITNTPTDATISDTRYSPTASITTLTLDATDVTPALTNVVSDVTAPDKYSPTTKTTEVTVDATDVTPKFSNLSSDVNPPSDNYTTKTTTTGVDIAPTEDATGKLTSLPTTITYDKDVPVSATSISVSTESLNVDSIGELIVNSLLTYLNEHEIIPKIGAASGGGEGTGSGSVDTSFITAIQTALDGLNVTSASTTILKELDAFNLTSASKAIQDALDALNMTKGAKAILDASDALNMTNSAKAILDALDALNMTKGARSILDTSDALNMTKGARSILDASDALNMTKGSRAILDASDALNMTKGARSILDASDALNMTKGARSIQDSSDALNATKGARSIQDSMDALNATAGARAIQDAIDGLSGTDGARNIQDAINGLNGGGENLGVRRVQSEISSLSFDSTRIQNALDSLSVRISSHDASMNATIRVSATEAKGNMGAFAKGNVAMAGGTRTLMGELGPEMVVSNGRYFLAGLYGAEFVDLDKDAIVFNHKQTERLLALGGIGSRGIPFTNEENAISYAKGNVEGPAHAVSSRVTRITAYRGSLTDSYHAGKWTVAEVSTNAIDSSALAKGNLTGPALASASAALAALKQLREMWKSLKAATAQDLALLGGSGGGGGGGTSSSSYKTYLKDLERWYNWLQKIADLETKINRQETLRAKIASDNKASGKAYYNSLKETLLALEDQLRITQDLMVSLLKYFEERREVLNSKENPFHSLYTFDENGLIIYLKGKFKQLSDMSGTDEAGKPLKSAKEQYKYIVGTLGISEDFLKYTSSGEEIWTSDNKNDDGSWKDEAYQSAVLAFWDKIEADKSEMQSLHDSINEYSNEILELLLAENELLQEMQDNLMEIENAILDAMVEGRLREIDKLSDLKDAYLDSSSKLISGLSDALSKERDRYTKSEEDAELLRLRRRLALLQRSGGSASEIADLQSLIKSKSLEAYFNELLRLIDALLDAADEQIARMDTQINILTETLDYLKKYGLLWEDVRKIMLQSPEAIAAYIKENTEAEWSKSPLASSEAANEWLFKAEQWVGFRDDSKSIKTNIGKLLDELTNQGHKPRLDATDDFTRSMSAAYGEDWSKNLTQTLRDSAIAAFKTKYEETGDYEAAAKAGKEAVDNQLRSNKAWTDASADYKTKYGASWNNLDSKTRTKLENAVRAKALAQEEVTNAKTDAERAAALAKVDAQQKIIDSTIKGAEKNQLFNSSTLKKKMFMLTLNKDGSYSMKLVKEGTKGADTYDKMYKTMLHNNARLTAWNAYEKKLASTYGATWTNLSAERKTKIKSLYFASYDSDENTANAEKAALKGLSSFLGTATLQTLSGGKKDTYGWTFVKNATTGKYEAKKVDKNKNTTGNKLTNYSTALRDALRETAWEALVSSYGVSWNMLTSKQVKAFKKIYTDAYNGAKTKPSSVAKSALTKNADFKAQFLNVKGKKQWASKLKKKGDPKSEWTVQKLTDALVKKKKTPSGKTIGTYEQAYNEMKKNNDLLAKWAKEKYAAKKKPTYSTKYLYERGGMVESTGTALLHAKESVLTAQLTDILRNQILGSRNDSLLNLLLDFKQAYNNIGNSTASIEPSIVILNASVNMNVASIANDYDARRAGEQALSEMLKIARKKGAASALRR